MSIGGAPQSLWVAAERLPELQIIHPDDIARAIDRSALRNPEDITTREAALAEIVLRVWKDSVP